MTMNRDKLENRLRLFRLIAADHPPGISRRCVENACAEIETHIREIDAAREDGSLAGVGEHSMSRAG